MKVNIIAHSIGCLQALKIEEALKEQNRTIQNIICLGAPLLENPLEGVNYDLDQVIYEV